jgi:hypothetical protein
MREFVGYAAFSGQPIVHLTGEDISQKTSPRRILLLCSPAI